MHLIVRTHDYAPPATDAPARPRAACADTKPDLFFPSSTALAQIEDAKAICRSCPLMFECLRGALERDEEYGVWGGMSEDERRSLRRSAASPVSHAA